MMLRSVRTRRWAFGLFLLLSTAYLVWRVMYSLNQEAAIYSWLFWGLETYGLLSALAFYWVIVERDDPRPSSVLSELRVDVFICTYNEPLPLLRQTLRHALAMDYPHRTFVLDDGRRAELQAMAAELGCEYLTRPRNEHYKAGNLNNALTHTDGDLVVVLDADHWVRKNFLSKLLGYFADPDVALVQTPQVFHNIDSFQHHFRPESGRLWHEGAIFHHAMQPGANRFNAAMFVGTGAILRRSALQRIGGFATGSVTEDVFTSMRLHALGYRSVYHDEPLAYLFAPESLSQYLTQRLRWGQGSLQILRMENPLTKPGLSVMQRLVYGSALSSFGHGILHLAYYLAPALYLLGGLAPIRVEQASDFAPILGHILIDLAMFKLMLGPLARPLLAECYKLLNLYIYIKSLSGYFITGRLKFNVTNKGRDGAVSARLLAPQLSILAINAAAFGCGMIELSAAPNAMGMLGASVATGFAGLFVVVGSMAVVFALQRIAALQEYTYPDHVAATVEHCERRWEVTATRFNEQELHLVGEPGSLSDDWGSAGVRVGLDLRGDGQPLMVNGRVRRIHRRPEGDVLTLALDALSESARDRLHDRLVDHSLPRLIDDLVGVWRGAGAGDNAQNIDPRTVYLRVEPRIL